MTGTDEGWTEQTFTGSAIGAIRCNSSSVGCTKSGLLGWQGSVHKVEIDMLAGFTGVYTESGLSC